MKPIAVGVPFVLTILVAGVTLVWLDRVCRTLPLEEPFRDYERFAAVIRRQAPTPQHVVFFRTEAHALAFHVGRPVETLSEWSDLDAQLAQDGTHYVVMPVDVVQQARAEKRGSCWEEMTSNVVLAGGKHERPLVLLRVQRPGATDLSHIAP